MNDLIAVIIPTWNLLDDLIDCIESIKRSTYPNLIIIVVDNNSTDGTSDYLKTNYPEILIIQNSTNLGFAVAVNQGITKAIELKSKSLFILNNDTIIFPNTISNLHKILKSDTSIGIISPKVMFFDSPDIIYSIGDKVYPIIPIPFRIGFKKRNKKKYTKLFYLDYVTGCAMLIPTSTINKVGYFTEKYFMYYEDAEYCFRARKMDLKIVCDGNTEILHKVAYSSRKIKEQIISLRSKNRILFFHSYNHGHFGFLSIPLIVIIDIVKIIKFYFIEHDKLKTQAYLNGIITGLREIRVKI